MANSKYCTCGNTTFYALMGIEQTSKDLTDPRRPGYNEVVQTLECTECGKQYDV